MPDCILVRFSPEDRIWLYVSKNEIVVYMLLDAEVFCMIQGYCYLYFSLSMQINTYPYNKQQKKKENIQIGKKSIKTGATTTSAFIDVLYLTLNVLTL